MDPHGKPLTDEQLWGVPQEPVAAEEPEEPGICRVKGRCEGRCEAWWDGTCHWPRKGEVNCQIKDL
jgi:hypothetical protein